jgi:hypothetical protein
VYEATLINIRGRQLTLKKADEMFSGQLIKVFKRIYLGIYNTIYKQLEFYYA